MVCRGSGSNSDRSGVVVFTLAVVVVAVLL